MSYALLYIIQYRLGCEWNTLTYCRYVTNNTLQYNTLVHFRGDNIRRNWPIIQNPGPWFPVLEECNPDLSLTLMGKLKICTYSPYQSKYNFGELFGHLRYLLFTSYVISTVDIRLPERSLDRTSWAPDPREFTINILKCLKFWSWSFLRHHAR